MTLLLIRILFVLISGLAGYYLGFLFGGDVGTIRTSAGAAIGIIAALSVIAFESGTRRLSTRNLSAAIFGLMFGLFLAFLVTRITNLVPLDKTVREAVHIIIIIMFCYLGMAISIHGKSEFNLIIPYVKFARQDQGSDIAILDTSVIIDGRIADICQTKFVGGSFIIPRFVLKELQQVADSSDALKRNRGRRGLDILNKIRKTPEIDVKIHEDDFPDIKEVDAKLVKLAKVLSAKVFTNDYNLNKIAELQGVPVLNINDLANALRPVVLPGEIMEAKIIKEGKEYNQGVAYLDDGTMVVVDNARSLIGRTVRVVVTSVLQTSAGRMIFAKQESSDRGRKR